MKSIKINIKTLNPIIISKIGNDANLTSTKDYIPGTSILGIFASKYIEKYNLKDAHKDATFYNWFLKGDIRFDNCYISDDSFSDYHPIPFSIRKKKYERQVYDFLLYEEINEQTENISGYGILNDKNLKIKSVKKGISFHHSRNWETGSAMEGQIFNYEYLKEVQYFTGQILGDDKVIEDFYKKFNDKMLARLGRSKNSQYGQVEIQITKPQEYKVEAGEDELDEEDVVMTLLSDTIIYNEFGFSTTNIKDIEKVLGVKIKKAFLKKDINEQFLGVWKLKTPSENIILAGSCFLLESLPENYKKLQEEGIGERTNEGFGRLMFGYQNYNEINIGDTQDINFYKPDFEMPSLLKEIIEKMVIKKLEDKFILEALEDAKDFKKLPSKSLLGKLRYITKDMESFHENFQNIYKSIAKTQLNKSHNGHQKLSDFIKEKKNEIQLDSKLENLLGEVGIDVEEFKKDEGLLNKLSKLYWETFFNSMSKREKGEV